LVVPRLRQLRPSAIKLRFGHAWRNGTKSDATTAEGRSSAEVAPATPGKVNAASSAYPSAAAAAATGVTATTATKPSTSATATVTTSPCDRA
jgi:hypothetical protein